MKQVLSAARFAGLELDERQWELLAAFRDWLATEGLRAGGIGPAEVPRIESRHLADSLLFASEIGEPTSHVLDLGTGVGLPGIPLAVAMPDTRFTLIDRSQRRIDLARRVIRILDLENCQVLHDEIENVDLTADVVVSRASLSPDRLLPVVARVLEPQGVAVVGGSWREPPSFSGWVTKGIPADVLDHPIWLLMMRSA